MSVLEIEKATKNVNYEILTYSRGELIYSPESYVKKIGFVIDGKCNVIRENNVILNMLSATDSFGILAVLSAEDFPTAVIAKTATKILFFNKESLNKLMRLDYRISQNVISFLTNRITFLNKKIAAFSADSVEDKLIAYILHECEKQNNTEELAFNCKHCAEQINAGRASVYRAIESLTSGGIINFANKKIYILDREGLERKRK